MATILDQIGDWGKLETRLILPDASNKATISNQRQFKIQNFSGHVVGAKTKLNLHISRLGIHILRDGSGN